MAYAKITIEVEQGPVLRAAMDVLDYTCDVADLIPDWHEPQRSELVSRGEALRDIMLKMMEARNDPK